MRPRRILSHALALALLAGAPHSAAAGAAGPSAIRPAPARSAPATAIHVTDAAGRTVTLAAPPRRIVVVGRGPFMTLDVLYMFPEARARLVGLEKKGSSASDFLPLVDPDFAKKTVLESPGPEEIAALHPDLVITRGSSLDPLGVALGEVRIPVVYLGLETPDRFYKDVAILGTLLGNPARAREITDYFRSRLARIRGGWAGIKRPRVLLFEYSDRGGAAAVRVPARSWMQTLEVESAGGDPVWLNAAAVTSGWTVTNVEQIARWDPDQIVVVVWYTLDPARVIADLKNDPRWSALRAVRGGRIAAFPSDYYGWDSPDPRWLLGVSWLATAIHPERFRDLDMTAEVHRFFGTLYGMDPAVVDAKVMPRIHLNVR